MMYFSGYAQLYLAYNYVVVLALSTFVTNTRVPFLFVSHRKAQE